jgi:hypothetical protein
MAGQGDAVAQLRPVCQPPMTGSLPREMPSLERFKISKKRTAQLMLAARWASSGRCCSLMLPVRTVHVASGSWSAGADLSVQDSVSAPRVVSFTAAAELVRSRTTDARRTFFAFGDKPRRIESTSFARPEHR